MIQAKVIVVCEMGIFMKGYSTSKIHKKTFSNFLLLTTVSNKYVTTLFTV